MGVVTVDQVLAFGLAAFILIVIPGPSVVFVIGRALAYGQGVALASVVGNSLGLFVVMGLVAFGLGAVVAESIVVFTVLKLAGAAYLVWLGVQALRHRRGLHVEGGAARLPVSSARAMRQGFVVGVSNPKGFMIFAALLPQFVERSQGGVPMQMFVLGLGRRTPRPRVRRGLGRHREPAARLVQRLAAPRPRARHRRRGLDDRARRRHRAHRPARLGSRRRQAGRELVRRRALAHLFGRLVRGAAVERRLRVVLRPELDRLRHRAVGEELDQPQRHVDPAGDAAAVMIRASGTSTTRSERVSTPNRLRVSRCT